MVARRTFLKQAGALACSLPAIIVPGFLQNKKLGVALLGLGYYSRDLLAPALQVTEHCELRGIITGTPSKIPVWQEKYGIRDRNVYNYENMSDLAGNDEIDVVYVVTPPALHAKYAMIAADAGKHVWCEKPMEKTVEKCQQIIDTCKKNKVSLSIGYRMQHEPNTRKIIEWAGNKPYGDITGLRALAGYREGRTNHWKQGLELGGGALYDMGVYCINGARYSTGMEPIAVSARYDNERTDIYKSADETTIFTLEFPGGIRAECTTSFARSLNDLHIDTKNGWYELSPFQSYSGIRGKTSDGKALNASIPNQQARQMDDDALAIMNNTEVLVPGIEGLRDIHVVENTHISAKNNGKRILL